ncbi:LCP family protein [uncultured Oscillibacter sp.]|mgnify:CR=1 FL=1|uniref:LCP family protein n=1 Tax=uncultured Oscillibacter sp. TaxID=876091 RepID=UPI0028052A56|nr:LCP family protein [uncultured Oscillibacter sp.]
MDRETGKHLAGGTPKKTRPKKQKRPSRLTRQQKLLIAVAAVLAVVLVAVVACQSLFVRPDLPGTGLEDGAETEEIDWGEGNRPHSGGERKSEDYYTVLILGRDTGGGGNTDTMLLASYDVTNQKATVMSIPRDTMVNVPYDIKRINAVYNYGGGGDEGIQYLYKEISQLVGFEPDYQVVVEWDAVGEIVDAMGGVWFDVPRNMNYDDPYQDLHIHQEKGYRLLSGDDAMQVLRYRHDNDMHYGYPDGDLGRIKTQQAFLSAMVEQLLKLENVTKIRQFIQVFQDNVETDLSFQNILWFAKKAVFGGLSMENVEFVTMPNKNVSAWSRTYQSYQSYVVPIADELLDLVNNQLSPFTKVFTLSDLDIMSVNSDGSLSSSTGRVEDSRAAQPPVRPSKPSTPEQPEEETPTVDENGNAIDPDTGLPVTGGETTDPGTTDPGTGETTPGTTGPGTGETTPGTGTTDPGTSETTPGTTDPGTGGTTPGTTDPGTGGTTDPGAGTSGGDSQTAGTGDSGGSTAAPDAGFVIVN